MILTGKNRRGYGIAAAAVFAAERIKQETCQNGKIVLNYNSQ